MEHIIVYCPSRSFVGHLTDTRQLTAEALNSISNLDTRLLISIYTLTIVLYIYYFYVQLTCTRVPQPNRSQSCVQHNATKTGLVPAASRESDAECQSGHYVTSEWPLDQCIGYLVGQDQAVRAWLQNIVFYT